MFPSRIGSIRALVVLAPVLAVLAACSTRSAEQAELAQTALIGLPKSTLLSCAGEPHRTRLDADGEYFTYQSERLIGDSNGVFGGNTRAGVSGVFGSGSGAGVGVGIGVPLGGEIRSTYCEATFLIRDDIVRDVRYRATSGIGAERYRDCAIIVRPCLDAMPAPIVPE